MRQWVTETSIHAFMFLAPIADWVLAVAVLVLLPLAIWKKTRAFAGMLLVYSSFVFGAAGWFLGAGITFGTLGWFWLILGLLFMGLGVVPLAMIAAVFVLHSWPIVGALALIVALTLGARFGGVMLVAMAEKYPAVTV